MNYCSLISTPVIISFGQSGLSYGTGSILTQMDKAWLFHSKVDHLRSFYDSHEKIMIS
jgi:hypothetical protein